MGYTKQGFRLNKGASGSEEKARLPRLNECISTSESKQTMFLSFSTINKRAKLT